MTDNRPAHAPTGPGWYWLRNGERDKIIQNPGTATSIRWVPVDDPRTLVGWTCDGNYDPSGKSHAKDIISPAEPPEEQPESSTDILSPVGRAGLELLKLAGSREQAVKVIEQVESLTRKEN